MHTEAQVQKHFSQETVLEIIFCVVSATVEGDACLKWKAKMEKKSVMTAKELHNFVNFNNCKL